MIKHGPKKLKIYDTIEGRQPYSEWLKGLRDVTTVARIRARIDRIEEGNFGDYKPLGTGLFEFKLSFGGATEFILPSMGIKLSFYSQAETKDRNEKTFRKPESTGRII